MKLFFGEIFPQIKIDDDEQVHITKVLRMREGDTIVLTDGNGNTARGFIKFEGKKVLLSQANITESQPPVSGRLHIAIAPTKNIDRTELFIEKATEMGVSEISFIQTEHSERKIINIEKLRKQVIAASKQSLRFHFPKVNDLVKLPDFLKDIDPEQTFVAHCDQALERQELTAIKTADFEGLTILIGPEGDFSKHEIQKLAAAGIRAVSLGPQRLRTETAGIFVAAWSYSQSF